MIEQLLEKLEENAERNQPKLWSAKEVRTTAFTFLGLLPTVALWYFWCLTALNVSLGRDKQDIWLDYLPTHLLIGLFISLLLLFVSRFSLRARRANKFGLLAIGLFVCGLMVIALPTGYGLVGLIPLGAASLFYWLTPWCSIKAQWQPNSQKPETATSYALQLFERIVDLPYPSIREAMLPLLQELMDLGEQRKGQKGEHRISFDEFCHNFSHHCAPLLGALSYRVHSLGNDAPALMQFIDTFPPFDPAQRIRYNKVEYYRNAVLNSPEADDNTKALYLKSGLIVADLAPATLADTRYDLELLLLPLLLKQSDQHTDEIIMLIRRFILRLKHDDRTLNVFQQNSWLAVLDALLNLPATEHSIIDSVTNFDRVWPQHRNSFVKGAYVKGAYVKGTCEYSDEREQRLNNLMDALHQRARDAMTGPSLIGIRSDLYKMGLYEDEEELEYFLIQLFSRFVEECAVTNHIHDADRYEYDIETRLNSAVIKRVDATGDLIDAVLSELKSDIESQGLDLSSFLTHLGYKFGALIYTIHQCFPADSFQWLLDNANNDDSIIDSELVIHHYLLRVMHLNMAFHHYAKQNNQQGVFDALAQLFILLLARYPFNREACEATLVTGLQLISVVELSKESIEEWFASIDELDKDDNGFKSIIAAAIEKFELLECKQLTEQQKNVLKTLSSTKSQSSNRSEVIH